MADRANDPGSAELERLFERERQRGEPSEDAKRDVRARLDASIAERQLGRPALEQPRARGPAGASATTRWGRVRPPMVAAGIGLIVVGGLGLLFWGHRPVAVPGASPSLPALPPPAPSVNPPLEPPVPAAPDRSATPPEPTPRGIHHPGSHIDRRASSPPIPAPKPLSDSDLDLAIERDLLQRARAEFRAGSFAEALRPLEEHARRFPRGRLEEERAALRIQALSRLGEHQQAAELARDFSARFPESPLLDAVRSSIGGAP